MTIVINTVATQAANGALSLSISDDGRYVAYTEVVQSMSVKIPMYMVAVYDELTGTRREFSSELAAWSSSARATAAALSGDGKVLAVSILTLGTGLSPQIGVRDLANGQWRDAATSADGVASNGNSSAPALSRDGRYVLFQSSASNLVAGDTNGRDDAFVKDMQTGAIERASLAASGAQLAAGGLAESISADGKVVLFSSAGAAGSGGRILYAKNLETGSLAVVNADMDKLVVPNAGGGELSADGRYAVFSVYADGADAHTAAPLAIYHKDLLSGELTVVSAAAGLINAGKAHISDDGSVVSYARHLNAEISAYRTTPEIYTRNMLSGEVNQVSAGAPEGLAGHALSGDGKHLVHAAAETVSFTAGGKYWLATLTMADLLPDAAGPAAGSAAPELFLARAGDQAVQGGAGVDTVLYSGVLGAYKVELKNGAISVADQLPGRDGTDLLSGVERVRFADGNVLAFDIDGNAGQAYRLYEAVLNRAPDAAGLGYWINRLDNGRALKEVANGFTQSLEFTSLYGKQPTSTELVERLYLNILNRPGEASGISYWTGVLDRHETSVADVLIGFADSTENKAALVGVLDHGFLYTHDPESIFHPPWPRY